MNKKRMGKPNAIVEVNGTELYLGGQLNAERIIDDMRVRVACVSCRFLTVQDGRTPTYSCGRIVDNLGKRYELADEARYTTRCGGWRPQLRWYRLGQSEGKVDPPGLVAWKAENPHIHGWPEEYGYTNDVPLRIWLTYMFAEGVKQKTKTPTTKKTHNEKK